LEQANLHLVGSGPDRARLESLTNTLGLNARVHFHGFVSDAEVACMAATADVFLLPSAVEGMPTVLIEMLLHGCPVLASDIPGNRAILEGVGQPGALYPLADISSLAARILSLSPARVSVEQRQRTLEQFTWEGMRARIKALYAGVMAN
jgi:glycosyltransferase involved in cell wall biosynthesis